MSMMLSRRHFLSTVSLAGAAAFIGAPQVTVAETALETTAVRLLKFPAKPASPESEGRNVVTCTWRRSTERCRCQVSAARHECVVHPTAGCRG
jgi:hypothetical protein